MHRLPRLIRREVCIRSIGTGRSRSSCIAIANPVNVAPVTGSATADTFGPTGQGRSAHILVSTFDAGGNNVPENVNVMVICP